MRIGAFPGSTGAETDSVLVTGTCFVTGVKVRGGGVFERGRPTGFFTSLSWAFVLGTLWRPLLVRPLPARTSRALVDIVTFVFISVLRFLAGGSSTGLSRRRDLSGFFAAAESFRSSTGKVFAVIRRDEESTGVSSSRGVSTNRAS